MILLNIQEKLQRLLNEGVAMGVFTKNVSEKLYVERSLPKIHKEVFPPPLQPIVAGIGSILEQLSACMDHHLQPLAIEMQGYIRDTKHIVSLPSISYLGTRDLRGCRVTSPASTPRSLMI